MNAYLIGSLKTGGAESAVRNVIKGMTEENKARVLIVLINDNQADEYAKQLGVSVRNLDASGVFSAVPKLISVIDRHAISRLHAHLAQSIIIGGLARAFRNFDLIAYIHTIGRWKQNSNLRQKARLICERLACNTFATKIVYVSKLIRDFHEKNLGYKRDHGMVISNPITGLAPLASHLGGDLKLITVGRMEPVKGIEWVVGSEWFCSFFKTASWTLVGDGSLFDAINCILKKNEVDSVQLLGNRSDVPNLLSSHNAFLLPSWSEGLSVAILEAMRAGLPIICTDVGANREMVLNGVNGFIIEPGDSASLHKALVAIQDPSLRAKMGAASRDLFHKNYDPDSIQRNLESLLA